MISFFYYRKSSYYYQFSHIISFCIFLLYYVYIMKGALGMDSYLISDSSCDSLKVMTEYKLIKDAVSGLKSLNDYEMNLLISLIFNQEQLVGD